MLLNGVSRNRRNTAVGDARHWIVLPALAMVFAVTACSHGSKSPTTVSTEPTTSASPTPIITDPTPIITSPTTITTTVPTQTTTKPPTYPNVAGDYTGTYTVAGATCVVGCGINIHLSQSGGSLEGISAQTGAVYADVGTVDTAGNIHIVEKGPAVLNFDATASGRHVAGTWKESGSTSSGTWQVDRVPTIAGYWVGRFDLTVDNGHYVSRPLQYVAMSINQIGGQLDGSTTWIGTVSGAGGTISTTGATHIWWVTATQARIDLDGSLQRADMNIPRPGGDLILGNWSSTDGTSGDWLVCPGAGCPPV
jgi:hypothetical protein